MRSEKINPLFSPISSLSGIGPKLEVLFNRFVGPKLIHLLWHIPYNVIKRNRHENIHTAQINSIVTLKVKILEHKPSRFKKQPYKVNCVCGEVPIDIVFFYARHPVIKASLPVDSERFISGKLEYFRNTFQITNPSHIIEVEKITPELLESAGLVVARKGGGGRQRFGGGPADRAEDVAGPRARGGAAHRVGGLVKGAVARLRVAARRL